MRQPITSYDMVVYMLKATIGTTSTRRKRWPSLAEVLSYQHNVGSISNSDMEKFKQHLLMETKDKET